MKKQNKWFYCMRVALLALIAGGFAACTADPIEQDGGRLAADGSISTGALYASGTLRADDAQATISENMTIEVVYRLTAPVAQDVVVTLGVPANVLATVEAYNDEHGLENIRQDANFLLHRYFPMPETNYMLPEASTLRIKAGEVESAPLKIELIYDKGILSEADSPWDPSTLEECRAGKRLILPLQVVSVTGVAPQEPDQILYYRIEPTDPMAAYPLKKPNDLCFICYIDPEITQPILVNEMLINIVNQADWNDNFYTMYDIANLLGATLNYDADAERPVLKLSTDLDYVLRHQTRYIAPAQKNGIKMCLTIKGGNQGLGFCNLSDKQITDLVWQIKKLLTDYRLDGVNLWDANAGYGQKGMPAVDPGSYPKFLKALRTALGADKTIMLTDMHNPQSGLYASQGGIEAGALLDYAWTGVANKLVNPWMEGSEYQPIVGLNPAAWSPLHALCAEDQVDVLKSLENELMDVNRPEFVAVQRIGCTKVWIYSDLQPHQQGYREWEQPRAINLSTSIIWPMEGEFADPDFFGMPQQSMKMMNLISVDGGLGAVGYWGYSKDW